VTGLLWLKKTATPIELLPRTLGGEASMTDAQGRSCRLGGASIVVPEGWRRMVARAGGPRWPAASQRTAMDERAGGASPRLEW